MNINFELREWRLTDSASLAENANNINIWNNLRDYFPYPYTENDAVRFIEMCMNKPKPATDFAIVVENKAVGGIGIILQNDVERITAEIGYWLGEGYRGRGIMPEAVKQMVTYAFETFSLQKIFASVFDFNTASHIVLQKAGFELEAILKKAAIKNNKIIDLHYYSLFKTKLLAKIQHRFYTSNDFPVLERFLYEAIHQSDDAELLPFDIVKTPELNYYIKDFGQQKGDLCIFAVLDETIIGAAWLRIWNGDKKGYGYIDAETPELSIAVLKEYRNLGVGKRLMSNIIDLSFYQGKLFCKQLSLSVQKDNHQAVKMYKKIGFEVVKENEHDYIMLLKKTDEIKAYHTQNIMLPASE